MSAIQFSDLSAQAVFGTSHSYTFPAVAAGSSVLFWFQHDSTQPPSSVTLVGAGAMTLDDTYVDSNISNTCWLYRLHGASGGQTQITFNTTGVGIQPSRVTLYESTALSGTPSTSGPNSGGASTSQILTATAAFAGMTAVGAFSGSGLTYSSPSGYTTFGTSGSSLNFSFSNPDVGDAGAKAPNFGTSVNNWTGKVWLYAAAGPTVTAQPQSQQVPVGSSAIFSVTATASGGSLSYQWQVSTDAGASYANVSGATSASYSTANTVLADNGKRFRCVVTDSNGSVNTAGAWLHLTGQNTGRGSNGGAFGLTGWLLQHNLDRSYRNVLLRKRLWPGDGDSAEAAIWGDWFWPASAGIGASSALIDAQDTATGSSTTPIGASASLLDATDALQAAGKVALSGSAALQDAQDLAASSAVASIVAATALTDRADTASAAVGAVAGAASALTDAQDAAPASSADAISAASSPLDATDGVSVAVTTSIAGASATAVLADEQDRATATSGAAVGAAAVIDSIADASQSGAGVTAGSAAALQDARDAASAQAAAAIAAVGTSAGLIDVKDGTALFATAALVATSALLDAADSVVAASGAGVSVTATLSDSRDIAAAAASAATGAYADAAIADMPDAASIVAAIVVIAVAAFSDSADRASSAAGAVVGASEVLVDERDGTVAQITGDADEQYPLAGLSQPLPLTGATQTYALNGQRQKYILEE